MGTVNVTEYWYLYALIKDSNPIYVGVTNNTLRRKDQHRRSGKIFDSVYVIKKYKDKTHALIAENILIRYNGKFDIGLINAKHADDSAFKERYL